MGVKFVDQMTPAELKQYDISSSDSNNNYGTHVRFLDAPEESSVPPPPKTTEERVAQMTSQRPDLLTQAGHTLQNTTQDKSFLQNFGNVMKSGMEAVGGIGQRIEAAGINPILGAMQGQNGLDAYGSNFVQGLQGKKLGEYGDVGRLAGAPEWASATGGLAASVLADPFQAVGAGTAKLGRFLRQSNPSEAIKAGASNLEKFLQKGVQGNFKDAARWLGKGTAKNALEIVQNQNPERVQYLMDSRFTPINKKYLTPKAAESTANSMFQDAENLIHKKASKAYESIAEDGKTIPVSSGTVKDITDKLTQLMDHSVGSETDITRVNNAIDKLKDPTIPRSLSDLLTIQKSLREFGKNSVFESKAAQVMGDVLQQSHPELKDANKLWRDWTQTRQSLENVFGKPQAIGTEAYTKKPKALARLFDDESGNTERNISFINDQLKKASNGITTDYLKESKHISAAAPFIQRSPTFRAGLNSMYAAAPIVIGRGTLNTAAAIGATAGLAASPRFVGRAARLGAATAEKLNTPRAKALRRMLEKTQQLTADPALTRQITGRNDLPEGYGQEVQQPQ